MVAAYVDSTSDTSGTGTATSFLTVLPTGWAVGDVCVLTVHYGGNSITATDPTGWTQIPGPTWPVTQGTSSRAYGWYRVMVGGDTAPTISLSGSATGCWAMTLVDGNSTSSPFGQVGTATGSGTSLGLPALTGVLNGSLLVEHAHARVPTGTANPTGITADADYTEREDAGTNRNTATSQNVRVHAATRAISAAGDYSGDTISVTSGETSSMFALVVEVVAAAAPPAEEPVVDGPAVNLAPRVQVLYDDRWQDITADADLGNTDSTQDTSRPRYEPGFVITRGRRPEEDQVRASTCDLVISNRDGKYSRRNPRSSLYGKITRNTQLRVANRILYDPFDNTSSSGWPDADTGQAWTAVGGDADDYTVTSGNGTITIDTLNSTRQVYAQAVQRADISITTTFAPGAVTTGATGVNQMAVIARRADADNYYYAVASFAATGEVDLFIAKRVGAAVTVLVTSSTGLTYDANTVLGVEFNLCGNFLEARCWDTVSGDSLYVSDTDTSLTAAGAIGVRAALSSAVTNTLPLAVEYGPITVLDIRHTGEVAHWPMRWDPTGRNVWTPVQSAGIMRRLAQAAPVLKSAIRRHLEQLDPDLVNTPVACWPLEEGPRATKATPLYGARPMRPFNGSHPSGGTIRTDAQWGRGTLGPWLPNTLALTGNAQLAVVYGPVSMPGYAADWWVEFVWTGNTDTAGIAVDVNPSYLGGSTGWPQLTLDPAARTVSVSFNGSPETTTTVAGLYDGLPHYVSWHASVSGGNTSWTVSVDDAEVQTDAEAGYSVPAIDVVAVAASVSTGAAAAIGYLTVWDDFPSSSMVDAARGWPGETAGARIQRLGDEEGVTVVTVGTAAETALVGPQRIATLLQLMQDCATTDQGILYEPRQVLGVAYRTCRSLYNQTAALALDYAAAHLSDPPEPADDEYDAANDVTAVDILGGDEARTTVTAGPLGTDTIGTYPKTVQANVDSELNLPDLASWAAHLGTWDEERWPRLTINLRRAPFTASQFLTDDACEADLGDLATVDNPPDWLAPDQVQILTVGQRETLTGLTRTMEFNATPAGPYAVAVRDDTDPRRDTSGSQLAAAFVAGTDVSMSVAVTRGPLWTTAAAYYPQDVRVAGARVRVTAVSGASSPQTFTVSATVVNGIAKTIPAGTAVNVWQPAVRGM